MSTGNRNNWNSANHLLSSAWHVNNWLSQDSAYHQKSRQGKPPMARECAQRTIMQQEAAQKCTSLIGGSREWILQPKKARSAIDHGCRDRHLHI